MMRADKPKAKLTQRIDSGGKKVYSEHSCVQNICVFPKLLCLCVGFCVCVCTGEVFCG